MNLIWFHELQEGKFDNFGLIWRILNLDIDMNVRLDRWTSYCHMVPDIMSAFNPLHICFVLEIYFGQLVLQQLLLLD
mgnify:CR=1 FL=1